MSNDAAFKETITVSTTDWADGLSVARGFVSRSEAQRLMEAE